MAIPSIYFSMESKALFVKCKIENDISLSAEKSRSYRDLRVWKEAVEFVKDVYMLTPRFPANEIYGLTNQIRRAAVSIPSNISEGQGRNSPKEFRQFLGIALGSVGEVETQLIIAKEIAYLNIEELNPLLERIDHIRE